MTLKRRQTQAHFNNWNVAFGGVSQHIVVAYTNQKMSKVKSSTTFPQLTSNFPKFILFFHESVNVSVAVPAGDSPGRWMNCKKWSTLAQCLYHFLCIPLSFSLFSCFVNVRLCSREREGEREHGRRVKARERWRELDRAKERRRGRGSGLQRNASAGTLVLEAMRERGKERERDDTQSQCQCQVWT